ncbi:hypothetical protein FNS61_23690 [Salmonella enterica]|nr:hypothetical protein [Salmonella enterica]ECC1615271.1 hypothetical protein [Salmonella enterica]ECD8292237.1 hypothetical protein [Salmonella enterica]ECF5979059.1 hypothetical protein [Salmonella enterica]EDT2467281.1 hypothetical protein [Salmonella enterica]
MKMTELAPGILASPCVPPACCRKAVQMVRLFRQGARNYRQLNDRGTRYYKINVGRAWRLLSRNRGETWELLSHERYNSARRK